jgi:pyridinium-3,5-biscarboxylic acid mononucleotide synthase
MEPQDLRKLLKKVQQKAMTVEQAAAALRDLPFSDLGFAKVDHHRAMRKGHPEVIFCQGKTTEQIVAITRRQVEHGETVFGTRASAEALKTVAEAFPRTEVSEIGHCFWIKSPTWKKQKSRGTIVIATAGTADTGVAEEARCTIEILGHPCLPLYDVGVAGIHRLLAHRDLLDSASVIICIAGMEGALPSVVAGMANCPVIGVPTSVGYGSHLNGMVPLFAMLNSCGSGLTVVNIDNGFGAGYAAAMMNKK